MKKLTINTPITCGTISLQVNAQDKKSDFDFKEDI